MAGRQSYVLGIRVVEDALTVLDPEAGTFKVLLQVVWITFPAT